MAASQLPNTSRPAPGATPQDLAANRLTADADTRARPTVLPRFAIWVCIGIALATLRWPDRVLAAVQPLTRVLLASFDWFFLGSVALFLLIMLGVALSRVGRMRLGAPTEEPEFSTLAWLAMLFAAGMGTGLMFWGVAEPLTHFVHPPTGVGRTAAAATLAIRLTNFHWGLHAWVIYCVAGLVVSYFTYCRGRKNLPGAPIRSAFPSRWGLSVAAFADLLALMAVAFGVAGSLSMGTLHLEGGLKLVFGVGHSGHGVPLALLALLMVGYTLSAATGIQRGIKWLSQINVTIAAVLLLLVFVLGPTTALAKQFGFSLIDYTTSLLTLPIDVLTFVGGEAWRQSWSLTWFVWWIAWAPFVGMFIARISRGRTIRGFIAGVLLVPTLFSVFWFAVFGGLGIHLAQQEIAILHALERDVTHVLFTVFSYLPLPVLLSSAALILVFVFLVTSVDSATYVLAILSSGGQSSPPRRERLFWAVGLGVLAGAFSWFGTVDAIKAMVVIGAVPFIGVLWLQVFAFLRVLWKERAGHA